MKIKIDDRDGWITYVPEYMGNRESEDPMTVEICPMSAEDTGRYQIITKERPGFRGQTTDNATEVTRKMFIRNVRNIRGLVLEDSEGRERSITTAEELWKVKALLPLIQEIQGALTDYSTLSEGMEKNSVSRPTTSSEKKGSGTA